MARPAKFTRFPNEILEALYRHKFNGTEMAVICLMIRKTEGWHKPWDRISLAQICKETGRGKRNVQKALKHLQDMDVLIKVMPSDGRTATTWTIETCPDNWKTVGVPKKATKEAQGGVAQKGHATDPQKGPLETENAPLAIRGAQKGHPSANKKATLRGRRVAQLDTHKRKELKKPPKESNTTKARSLSLCIAETLSGLCGVAELTHQDREAIKEVCARYPNPTKELLASFRNFVGIQEMHDGNLVKAWSQCAGKYLVERKRPSGMKPLGAPSVLTAMIAKGGRR